MQTKGSRGIGSATTEVVDIAENQYLHVTANAGDGTQTYFAAGEVGTSHEIDLDVYELTGGNYTISVVQQVDSGWEEIGSASVTTTGMVMINFTPQQPNLAMIARSTGSGSSVKVRIADGKYTNERAYGYSYTLCSKPRDNYRYGFNGKEKDNEWSGIGNHLDFGERGYDSRIARWLSIDVLAGKHPDLSPYNFAFNNPITFIDKKGKDGFAAIVDGANGQSGTIFIVATYYIVENSVANKGFNQQQINAVKGLQNELNRQNLKVTKDITYNNKNLKGYNVQFIINVQVVKSSDEGENNMGTVSVIVPRGEKLNAAITPNNLVLNHNTKEFAEIPGVKDVARTHHVKTKSLSGVTSSDGKRNVIDKQDGVIANQQDGGTFESNMLHEIFHSYGVDKDGALGGVGTGNTTILQPADVNDAVNSLIRQGKVTNATEAPKIPQ